MWQLSGFADEISPDVNEQCRIFQNLGIHHLEVRSAWGTNILDLDSAQLSYLVKLLTEHNLDVSSIGSPIGKVHLDEDFIGHLARMRHAADVARRLGARYIRIFSFFMRPGINPDNCRDEVIGRLAQLARIAEAHDVTLIHENEKDIYGDTPTRCRDLIESVASDHLRATWDPANFVQVGCAPYDDGYDLLRPYLVYMQIKDAVALTGAVVPAGQGDGQVRQTIRALRADEFDGFFSLEPHLGYGHRMGGFSGPDLFTDAWRAFVQILAAENIEYE
jgi:sugar phosphate isomerase/epimerase